MRRARDSAPWLNPQHHPIALLSRAFRHRQLPSGSREITRADRFIAMSATAGGAAEIHRWEDPLAAVGLDVAAVPNCARCR